MPQSLLPRSGLGVGGCRTSWRLARDVQRTFKLHDPIWFDSTILSSCAIVDHVLSAQDHLRGLGEADASDGEGLIMLKSTVACIAWLLMVAPAAAEPTQIVVRVISQDGKFVGDHTGGASITLREVKSGRVLARGVTRGGTGDTERIMEASRRSPSIACRCRILQGHSRSRRADAR
jgi:hypothetical protein